MDETTKQTSPAPWRVELETWSEGQKLAVVDADGRFVATIMTEEDMEAAGDVCLELAERDAHLIAAAPELLEALRQLLKTAEVQINGLPEEMRRYACAAIAKAKGVKP